MKYERLRNEERVGRAHERVFVRRSRKELTLDELDLVIQAALDDAGLAWVSEDRVTEHLASGSLLRVLEDWCSPFPGFFLYSPSQRQQPAALAALVSTLRIDTPSAAGRQP